MRRHGNFRRVNTNDGRQSTGRNHKQKSRAEIGIRFAENAGLLCEQQRQPVIVFVASTGHAANTEESKLENTKAN